MKTDLHTHSIYSDGTDSIQTLVSKCKENGIDHVSLTDHDCIDGTAGFVSLAEHNGIHVIPGIEFSAEHPRELHILCYNYDLTDKSLNEALDHLKDSRKKRVYRMMRLLQEDGFDIDEEEIWSIIGDGVPTRPHIAQILVNKGYCSSIKDAFDRYIGNGRKYFVAKDFISKKDIFSIAEKCSGITVLAHPGKIHEPDFEILLKELVDYGLKGIEAYYPVHNDDECHYYLELAKKYGLIITQGSDNHGSRRDSYLGKETRGNGDVFLQDSIRKLFRK